MRFTAGGNGHVEIDAGYDGSDFTVTVAVAFDGFSGSTGTWVAMSAWRVFIAQLVALEATRFGSATLTAPEALVTIRADRDDRMSVEGFVATYEPLPAARLTFAARSFDSKELPRIVRELRAF